MFEPTHIEMFMGGKFTIEKPPQTSDELAAIFEAWAKECRGWQNAKISEAAILQNEIAVTLEEGIAE